MQTTVDASKQFGAGAGYGLGMIRLGLGCGGQIWSHGGEIAGYTRTVFSARDAARQLVLMDHLLPAPGGAVQSAMNTTPSARGSAARTRSRLGFPLVGRARLQQLVSTRSVELGR
jgi:hypothetical protein